MNAPLLIGGVGLVYLIVAGLLARERNWGMALTHVGYALGNVGIIIAIRQGTAGA